MGTVSKMTGKFKIVAKALQQPPTLKESNTGHTSDGVGSCRGKIKKQLFFIKNRFLNRLIAICVHSPKTTLFWHFCSHV